jgi:hypothetical protein
MGIPDGVETTLTSAEAGRTQIKKNRRTSHRMARTDGRLFVVCSRFILTTSARIKRQTATAD